ncbi:MAG TPA: DUF6531 domain-containing protein, partial [Candidatus Methylomirabilis sp.]|nr:DUF6531 domain-containing protein [Candidatus Methylomirabilis sp.]
MRAPRSNRVNMLGLLATLFVALVSLLLTSPARAEKDPIPTFRGVVITDPSRPPYQIQVVIRPDRDDGGELASQWFTEAGSAVSFEIQMPNVHYQTAGPTFRVEARASGYYPKYERVTLSNCTGAFTYYGCDRAEPVTLRPAARYGNLAGTVRYTDGRPVAEAYLSAYAVGAPFTSRSSGTDATGAFTFTTFGLEVPEGRPQDYDVTVLPPRGERFGPIRVTVNGGATTWIELVIPAPPPPENRPQETAQGPPPWNCPECCLLYVGGPVNVATGNMYTRQEDLAYPSAFGRFAFTRTYNSQSSYAGPLGPGWTHPFEIELQEVPSCAIRLRNGAGNVRFYEVAEAGETTVTYRVAAPARDASTLLKHGGGYTESERDGLRREFGLDGRLQTITTLAGWRTIFGYSENRLTTVTDPGGRTLGFSYDGSGRLIRVEGPGGLFAEYGYDSQGQLMTVADALGIRWTYSYTPTEPSRLGSVRDANGNLVEGHTYDGEGRVIATTAADGVTAISLEYLGGNQTKVTDSLGRVTTYTFGMYGDLPLVTGGEGPCPCGSPDSTIEYDAAGRRVTQTDARGNRTKFEYDAAGNLIKLTDALGQVRTWS